MRRPLVGEGELRARIRRPFGLTLGQAAQAQGQQVDLVGLRAHDVRQIIDGAGQVGDLFFEAVTHGGRMRPVGARVNLAARRPLG